MTGEIIFIIHCSTNNAISFPAIDWNQSKFPTDIAANVVHQSFSRFTEGRHRRGGKSVFRSSRNENDIPFFSHIFCCVISCNIFDTYTTAAAQLSTGKGWRSLWLETTRRNNKLYVYRTFMYKHKRPHEQSFRISREVNWHLRKLGRSHHDFSISIQKLYDFSLAQKLLSILFPPLPTQP